VSFPILKNKKDAAANLKIRFAAASFVDRSGMTTNLR